MNPDEPSVGTIVVNINRLDGINADPGKYEWLCQHFEPADHIAYSWLVYNVARIP